MKFVFYVLLSLMIYTFSSVTMDNTDVTTNITEKNTAFCKDFFTLFYKRNNSKEITLWIKHSSLCYIRSRIENNFLEISCATNNDDIIEKLKNDNYEYTIWGEKYTELLTKNNLGYITFYLHLVDENAIKTVCENIFKEEPRLSGEMKESFITKVLNYRKKYVREI